MQKTILLANKHVVAYLGSMETAKSGVADEEAPNDYDADDFS